MNEFSSYLESKRPTIKRLIEKLSAQYEYVSVLGTHITGKNYTVSCSSTNIVDSPLSEQGFVIKIYNGKSYSEYSTTNIPDKHLTAFMDTMLRAVEVSEKLKRTSVKIDPLQENEMRKSFRRISEGKEYTAEEIVARLSDEVQTQKMNEEKLLNVNLSYSYFQVSKLFISNKKELDQYYEWHNVMASAVVRREENIKSAYASTGTGNAEEALFNLHKIASQAVDYAVKKLDAFELIPGRYTVITAPSISGLIAHEAFGHGVEMDMFVKNRAMAKDYVGKQVASPIVNMKDGAESTYSVASYFFDDDGILAHDTQIIKNGILQTGISDLLSASILGTDPTGNGRRESFKRKTYTRMTNTFFEKGTDKVEDMIASVKYGFLLDQTNNGMEDPKNWNIQCTADIGFEIKDGKLTGRVVTPVVISGNVLDLLNSISQVSDECTVIGSGSCGKGHKEWVRVSDGGPYLKCEAKLG